MSGLILDMTYKDVRNVISGWIVSNCYNVQSMRLPECFQANYTKTLTANGTGTKSGSYGTGKEYKPTCTIKISNYIGLIGLGTINQDITRFLNNMGITNMDTLMTDDNFLECMNNMVSFICAHCCFVASPFNDVTETVTNSSVTVKTNTVASYLVYYSSGTPENTMPMTNTTGSEKIITASDVNKILKGMLSTITSKIHTKQIKYTISFS